MVQQDLLSAVEKTRLDACPRRHTAANIKCFLRGTIIAGGLYYLRARLAQKYHIFLSLLRSLSFTRREQSQIAWSSDGLGNGSFNDPFTESIDQKHQEQMHRGCFVVSLTLTLLTSRLAAEFSEAKSDASRDTTTGMLKACVFNNTTLSFFVCVCKYVCVCYIQSYRGRRLQMPTLLQDVIQCMCTFLKA